uniref:Uncharacterized protein n=1 Tax=Arundo donax TaxID=35708 RepID=A0A0A9CHQ5_ARUDO
MTSYQGSMNRVFYHRKLVKKNQIKSETGVKTR